MCTYSVSGGSALKRGSRIDVSTTASRGRPSVAMRPCRFEANDKVTDRLPAMRQRILLLKRQLGAGEARFVVDEVRVVTEASGAARRVDDCAVPRAIGD